MWERIKAMRERFEEIEAAMATQEVALDPARLHRWLGSARTSNP